MPKKAETPHCPNCGAPVPVSISISNMVKCEYCGSYVNISEYIRSKAPPAPTPAPPRPVQRQPLPSEQRPKVTYKPEDYIDYRKPQSAAAQLGEYLLKLLIAAVFVVFMFALTFGGC